MLNNLADRVGSIAFYEDIGIRAKATVEVVIANATVEGVTPTVTVEGVNACTTAEGVGSVVTCEGIAFRRADEVLDEGEGIASCIVGCALDSGCLGSFCCKGEADGNTVIGGGVACRVCATATVEPVRTIPTDEDIIAIATAESVGCCVTCEGVVECRAREPFDADEGIASCVVGCALDSGFLGLVIAEGEADGNTATGTDVAYRVRAIATVDPVRTCATVDPVIALPTVEGVTLTATPEFIRTCTTAERVGCSVTCEGVRSI